jgi:hypothetical protein
MVRLALCALVLAGCYGDRYHCTSDEQCDLGTAARCEADGLCTEYDASCTATQRRYSAHAGDLSNTCFEDHVLPANPCTGNQPAAPRQGCFAQVCDTVPACCDLAWTDVCVELAEQVCDVHCDTRLAVTAVVDDNRDHYDVRWTGDQWTIAAVTDLDTPVVWVAPAPGEVEPRLAGKANDELVIGDTRLPAGATYCRSLTTMDIDRDARDTLLANYTDGTGEIWKLDDRTLRENPAGAQTVFSWGDINRDAFPDAVWNTNGNYRYLENVDDGMHRRQLLTGANGMVQGGGTPEAPPIRNVDWLDFDGDHLLDFVVFGASLRIHTRADGLNDVAQFDLDCDPPSTMYSCRRNGVTYGGAALQSAAAPSLIVAVYPGRKLYRAQLAGHAIDVQPLPFPGDTCTCPSTCTNCPGALCSCTYDCSTCNTVEAVVARDLDGDKQLDVIAIDSRLRIYTGLAANGFAFDGPTPIVETLPPAYDSVDVSAAGAPIP